MPDGAWDCHAHVIGDPRQYSLSPRRVYEPPLAPLDDYLALLDEHRIARGVLVQPSVYGFDNRCLLEALHGAEGRLLGIAVPGPDVRHRDLEELHRHGVRGVRCNLLNPGGLDPEVVVRWRPVLRALGWHVEVQLSVQRVPDLRSYLARFGVPVVVDHMGRPDPGKADPRSARVRALVDLVREGACFVKLSAPYRLSQAAPPWSEVAPLARAFLSADPGYCLWATDWPHTNTPVSVAPTALFQALDEWCPDTEQRRVLMAQAPARLFGG